MYYSHSEKKRLGVFAIFLVMKMFNKLNLIRCCFVLQFYAVKCQSTSENLKVKKNSTDSILRMMGYPSESHYTTTDDGYILNLHRIPGGASGYRNGKTILLQHGFEDSSATWILLGSGKSLGLILADAGYDVWLANSRGNFYSRNHTTLGPDTDSEFWDFSWHELGLYDLPATVDYILKTTGNQSLYFCGHSQGATLLYVMCSLKPEYNEKIKLYVHLAPVAFMDHLSSPLLRFLTGELTLSILSPVFGDDEFLPNGALLTILKSEFCEENSGTDLCKNFLFSIFGFSHDEINSTVLAYIMTHLPAGAATKQLVHFGQEIQSGYFRQYDYGFFGNIKEYKQFHPPDYDLSKVTASGYILYSSNDWICAPIDIDRLHSRLGNVKGKLLISKSTFNHLDFLYGINAKHLVYDDVLRILSEN